MSQRRARLILTLPILLVSRFVIAQIPPPAKPNPAEPEAYKLLEDIAERVAALRSRNNRLHASCDVADLIWDKDQKRGRSLFEGAMKELSEFFATYDFSQEDGTNEFNFLYQQRQQIVERIANHDPQLALTFLRGTRRADNPRMSADSENERNLEMHLAGLIASRDPELALKLASSSLTRGLSYNAINLLNGLHKKDPATAQKFYGDLVDRVAAEDLSNNLDALNVAANLISSYLPPKANEQTYRQLVEIVVNRVLAISPGDSSKVQQAQNVYHQVRNVLPQIEKYLPARVPGLQQWSRAVERTFDANSRRHVEMNELTQRGTVDELLAAAQGFPAELQPQIHQQAIWKALNTGELDRARQLVNQLISDPGQLQQMLGQIESHQLWKAVADNKVADARRLLNTVKQLDQRIQILTQLAGNLAAKGDKKGGVALLDEARVQLADLPTSAQKLNAQLQLARSYSDLDPDQGVTLLQSIIVQLNPLISAAAVLDGFDNRYLSEGEWLPQSYSGLSNAVSGLQQALGHYAGRVDTNEADASDTSIKRFASANSLAEQLERPEIRLQTQLQLVRAVLQRANTNRAVNFGSSRRTLTFTQ